MHEQEREPGRDRPDEDGGDLEYDLAHESVAEPSGVKPEPETGHVTVVTGTPDYDGDYSYDLAHDIPGN